MLILSLCSIFRYFGTGSFCGQTLGPLPLGLAQPVIIRQQSLGQDGFAPLSHLLCHIGHRSGTAIAESRRYTEHARDIAIFIIAQSCAITNKKQRLFAIFYKLSQVSHGAGIVVHQTLVGLKVESRAVHLRTAGIQRAEHGAAAGVGRRQRFQRGHRGAERLPGGRPDPSPPPARCAGR